MDVMNQGGRRGKKGGGETEGKTGKKTAYSTMNGYEMKYLPQPRLLSTAAWF